MLIDVLYAFLKCHGFDRTYWLAYSGGLDSRVLLRLCIEIRKQFPFALKAVHVHHGLSPQADQWLTHCQQVCVQEQVDFIYFMLKTSPSVGESIEEYARRHRYQQLAQVITAGDMLLTAHHQDDQAETVLLQLIRGAGPKGLSAMPKVKNFSVGLLGRPLLTVTRTSLRAYAEAQQLNWVEDELNIDAQYSRNYLRHQIMPLLKDRWPSVTTAIARAADHCAEAQTVLTHFAAENMAKVKGSQPNTLSIQRLLALEPMQQRLMLRFWFEQQQVLLPSTMKLSQILRNVLPARPDGSPCVTWGKVELRRYQNELYLLPALLPQDKKRRYHWDLQQPLSIPGIGTLIAHSNLMKIAAVEVRFRQGGERYRLATGHHHPLKKFFQEQKIPPWLRDRLPLIYVEDELAAIPGYLVVDQFKTLYFQINAYGGNHLHGGGLMEVETEQ